MTANVQVVRVELKYCEACGALRLRASSNRSAYCRRCEKIMGGLARADQHKAAEGRRP